jgi:hypothetical protein
VPSGAWHAKPNHLLGAFVPRGSASKHRYLNRPAIGIEREAYRPAARPAGAGAAGGGAMAATPIEGATGARCAAIEGRSRSTSRLAPCLVHHGPNFTTGHRFIFEQRRRYVLDFDPPLIDQLLGAGFQKVVILLRRRAPAVI